MTLPEQMTDRWARRSDPAPGQRTLYWHILMRDYPAVGDLAGQARRRLAPFTGLHMTPLEWLHMTIHVAGPAEQPSDQQMQHMTAVASEHLTGVPPITVSLSKILYHPEAIMLAVTPADNLAPIRAAALAATNAVISPANEDDSGWTPHVTLCYSTAQQPARPIITALGRQLPERQIDIHALSLVIQDGPERDWNWTTAGTIRLRTTALAQHRPDRAP
jgi:2'-5' RNA ligase